MPSVFCPHCQRFVSRTTAWRHSRKGEDLVPAEPGVRDERTLKNAQLLHAKIFHNMSTVGFNKILAIMAPGLTFKDMIYEFKEFLPSIITYPLCSACQRIMEEQKCVCGGAAGRTRFVHLPLGPRIRNWYKDRVIAKLLQYPWSTKATENKGADVVGTPLWSKVARMFAKGDIFLGLTSDSFNISSRQPYSVTALVLKVLNLPPWIRDRAQYQILWGLVPGPGAFTDPDKYLEVLIPELKALGEEGVLVHDANTGADNVTKKAVLVYSSNDMRAIAKLSGSKQTPAFHGACNCCYIEGVRIGRTTTYPGSVQFLPLGHPLRETYAQTMPVTVRDRALKASFAKQTQASINKWQRKAVNGELDGNPYVRRDMFLDLKYWSTTNHLVDGAHVLVNTLKAIWGAMINVKQFEYSLTRHRFEVLEGRFRYLSERKDGKIVGVSKPPWVLPRDDQKRVSDAILTATYFGPRLPDVVNRFGSLKFADWMLLASNITLTIL